MNTLYWLVTITDRPTTDAFLKLYQSFGVNVSLRTVGAGTAIQETLSTLGLEKTEKAVLFAVITADSWPRIQKALRRQMRIDVPGTGIAVIVPVSSIGGKRALLFLTEHQTLELKEESTLKDTRYDLLLVIANQGYTGSIMDAARAAGAGGVPAGSRSLRLTWNVLPSAPVVSTIIWVTPSSVITVTPGSAERTPCISRFNVNRSTLSVWAGSLMDMRRTPSSSFCINRAGW